MKRHWRSVQKAAGWFSSKRLFTVAASASFAVLVLVGMRVTVNGGQQAGAVATLNLWVDMAIGGFTLLGLYWAAKEFADANVRPNVRLHLAIPKELPLAYKPIESGYWPANSERITILRAPGGHRPVSNRVVLGAFLFNRTARAARNVLLRVHVRADPVVPKVEFRDLKFPMATRQYDRTEQGTSSVSVQFGDSLVVYQYQVLVGTIELTWPRAVPDKSAFGVVVIDYEVHTLDGPSGGSVEIAIVEDLEAQDVC